MMSFFAGNSPQPTCEFLQPEAGFVPRIAERVIRGQYHQYFMSTSFRSEAGIQSFAARTTSLPKFLPCSRPMNACGRSGPGGGLVALQWAISPHSGTRARIEERHHGIEDRAADALEIDIDALCL